MKPLLTVLVFGASLTIVAAGVPSLRDQLLNAVIPTASAQQDRGHGDKGGDKGKDKEDKDDDRDRGDKADKGKDSKDRDHDRDSGDTDRGAGKGADRAEHEDHGGGNDKDRADHEDKGGGHDKEHEDRGGSAGHEDRGGGNNGADGSEHEDNRGGNKDQDHPGHEDNRGGNKDPDRGPPDDNRGGSNRDPDRPGHNDPGSSGNNNEGRGPNENAGEPSANNPSRGNGGNDNGGSNAGKADRNVDPQERAADESDSNDRAFASRFDLDDTETFDDDGFLARRGEIIAMSRDTLLRRRVAALGLQVVEQQFLASLNTTMYRLSVPAAAPIDGILARLRAQDPEGVFDRNHLYERSASSVASSVPGMQPHALVDTAKGISVGLIDTGVDALHPALAGTHVELQYFVDQSQKLPEEHGTAVVSLLVSPQFGVLPDAQLYVACVFFEDRRGTSLSEAQDLVRALDWLMQRRVPVINMSLTGPPNEILRVAIARAISAGHLIVAAVGNAGPAAPPLYPAAYDGVIGVTAVDEGQHVYRRANRGPHVQLAAMGVDVVAAGPAGPTTYSGTSFASPYVAALAATEYRSLDPEKALSVKRALQDDALDLGTPGRDEIYGFGLARPRAIATVAR